MDRRSTRVELRGVSKRSRGRVRVEPLDVVLEGGRVYGLVGPNGAGKSTLLAMIAGLTLPTSGVVVRRPAPGRPAVTVAAVLDHLDLHPSRSVVETVRLAAMLRNVDHRAADRVIERCGLAAVRRRSVRRLSLGMRARLGIAAALLGSPDVVLLDEPMNGLDPNGMAWIREIVRDLQHAGCVVVVSSHLLSEIEAMSDEVVVLSQGRVVSTMRPGTAPIALASVIEVDRPDELGEALRKREVGCRLENGVLDVDMVPADVVRLAVAMGLDVHSVASRPMPSLHSLFDRTTVGEFATGGTHA